jgi:hypothetical protein
MILKKGKVMARKDYTEEGCISVCPVDRDDNDSSNHIDVRYVSPYAGGAYAGFVAIPEEGTTVLYVTGVQNDDENENFYMGCIPAEPSDLPEETKTNRTGSTGENTLAADPDDYKYDNLPMSYGIRTPTGQRLLFQEGRDETEDSKRIQLESSRGHGLNLEDSSNTQKVNLHSAHQGASLKLTDIRSELVPGPDAADLKSQGNMSLTSMEGGIKMGVVDGTNIEITNRSTGSHAGVAEFLKREVLGNIQMYTDKGDVDIKSGGNGVFIDCYGSDPVTNLPGASFQVRSENRIHLYSTNGIDIKSSGDINIKGRNVRIQSDPGGKVELNPTYPIDAFIGIRKTHPEIVREALEGAFPFFVADENFTINYKLGANDDLTLV